MSGQKLDLFALNKAEYAAKQTPSLVTIDDAWFLVLDGSGHPSGQEFETGLEALYAVAYALKFKYKAAGLDFAVSKLEGLWSLDPGYDDFATAPHDAWNWTLAIRIPDVIGENDVDEAAAALLAKGKPKAVKRVGVLGFSEGLCAQMLHVGPYDQEGPTLAALRAFIEEKNLIVVGRHHEIYLSDPRRTEPEKLKTIIRLPVIQGV